MTSFRKSQQEKLKIVLQPNYCREHFYINECNAEAYHLVVCVPPEKWHNKRLLLIGDEHSGKTHLAHIWSDLYCASFVNCNHINQKGEGESNIEKLSKLAQSIENVAAVICENIEGSDQEMLFHCINIAHENNKPLLMTTKNLDDIILPDLRSRLRATHTAILYQPNDDLARVIVNKLLSDHQIRIGANFINKILDKVKKYGWSSIDQIIATEAKLV